jgi:hypothetical protein
VQCRRPGARAGADLANGLLDLSINGLQFLSREPLAVGDTLEIVLNSGRSFDAVRRQGTVCWVLPLAADACFAGVQLREPLAEADLQRMCQEPAESPADVLAI